MFFRNFVGGARPKENKLTASKKIEHAKVPEKLIIPLKQHMGNECKPLVKVGDHVKKYQKIGDGEGMCVPVHASSSGKVLSIEEVEFPCWGNINSIIIKTDGKDKHFDLKPKKLKKKGEMINAIREAGIVGLGGAAFPTHIKLSTDKNIDTLIINACECEPYITSDHRLLKESPEYVIEGIKYLMKILGAEKTIIGIEDNKRDVFKGILDLIKDEKKIFLHELFTKYPQGAEKTLIYALTKKKIAIDKIPADYGIVVHNVSTAFAVYEAIGLNKPLVERVVTITGNVKSPKNLIIRLGTPIDFVLRECGGMTTDNPKVIMGGPMMGLKADAKIDSVIKANNCILVLEDTVFEAEKCIRCGKCVQACPMNLVPALIARNTKQGKIDVAEKMHAMHCYECGSCSLVCPSRLPLLDLIKKAKKEISKNDRNC